MPLDLGMIQGNASLNTILKKMKSIENQQTFAISRQKQGDVPSPTITEKYVVGQILISKCSGCNRKLSINPIFVCCNIQKTR